MAQTIKLKRSSVAGKVPTTGQLEIGELALNSADGKVYFERGDTTVQSFFTTNTLITGSLQQSGSDSYFLSNVGIGTDSPSAKMHIGPDALVSGYVPTTTTLAVSDTTNGAELILRGQSPRLWFDATAGGNGEIYMDGTNFVVQSGDPTSPGSSRLYIDSSGNVGIGTTTPQEKLHVDGNISGSDTYINDWGSVSASLALISGSGTSQTLQQVTDNGATTDNSITILGAANNFKGLLADTDINLTFGSTSGAQPRIYLYGTANGQANAGDIFMGTANNTGTITMNGDVSVGGKLIHATELYIEAGTNIRNEATIHTWANAAGTTEYGRFDSSGRLLLGTNTNYLGDKLQVVGTAYTTSGWRVGTATTYVGKLYNNSGILSLEADGTRDIQIGNSTTDTAMIFVEGANGKVGIGNSSPSYLLSVGDASAGDNTSNPIAVFYGQSSTSPGILKINDGTTGNGETAISWGSNGRISGEGGNFNINTSGNEIIFSVNSLTNTVESNAAAYVSASGDFIFNNNVGIGTTSPSYKLDVNGPGRFTDDLITSGSLVVREGLTMYGGAVNDSFVFTNLFKSSLFGKSNVIQFRQGGSTPDAIMFTYYDINPMLTMIPNSAALAKVGINNADPQYSLDVSGSGNFTNGLTVTGSILHDGDLTVTGRVTAEEFHTEFVSASIVYQSGSTKFGDTSDDVHSFTGSLDVKGTISTNDELIVDDGTRGARLLVDAGSSGNRAALFLDVDSTDGIGVGSDYFNISQDGVNTSILSIPGTSTGGLHFRKGSTELMYIQHSGNVGIGTTSPGEKLTVVGNLLLNNAGEGWIKGYDNYHSIKFRVGGANKTEYYEYGGTLADGLGHKFFTGGTTSQTLKLQIADDGSYFSGNVGIGTTSPGEKLEVAGNIYVSGSGSDTGHIYFKRYNNTANVGGIGWHTDSVFYIGGHPSYGPTGGNIVRVYGFGSDIRLGDSVNGDVLTVSQDTGNVGIGTTSPSQKLHVAGNLRLTGAFYDSNNSAGSSNQILSSTGTGTDWVSLSEITGVDGTGEDTYVAYWSDPDTITGDNRFTWDGTTLSIGGTLEASEKSFVIDHPTKKDYKLVYGALEGPEHGVYCRGRVSNNGIIELPEEWTGLVDENTITVQLTPIGKHQNLYVEDIYDNKVEIKNGDLLSSKVNAFYFIQGTRKDIKPLQTLRKK